MRGGVSGCVVWFLAFHAYQDCVFCCLFSGHVAGGGSAANPTPAAISPGAQQQQQQQQQQGWGTGSASSSRSVSPLPDHLHPQQQQQQQHQWDSEGDTTPQHQQQQQQQRQGKEGSKQHKREFPSLGVNAEGYPMYRGAPNCPFYMGTGRCDFGLRCKFHHPANCLHPECVMEGKQNGEWCTAWLGLGTSARSIWAQDAVTLA
jgi:hypothetical protein